MCTASVLTGGFTDLAKSKPVANVINYNPASMVYKAATGQKASDAISGGSAYAGIAGNALMNKTNQFSTA